MLTDEQEKSIAREKLRGQGCDCDPILTVERNRGVFAVMVGSSHSDRCAAFGRVSAKPDADDRDLFKTLEMYAETLDEGALPLYSMDAIAAFRHVAEQRRDEQWKEAVRLALGEGAYAALMNPDRTVPKATAAREAPLRALLRAPASAERSDAPKAVRPLRAGGKEEA